MVTVAIMPSKLLQCMDFISFQSSDILFDVWLLTSDGCKVFSVSGLHMNVVCNGLSI